MSLTIVVIAILFILLVTVALIAGVIKSIEGNNQKYVQSKEVLEKGTSAQATINSIEQTNVRVDEQPQILLDLTVTKKDGELHHMIHKTIIPIAKIPEFQKGNIVEVKYLTIDNKQKFEVVGAYIPTNE
ncbi:hypothetical protein [Bacillus horti]|uniref:Uncharacterized protein n=1 Tax=Caldalkalibacillus horti TaxID=77523 RepID=A0ABT9W1Q3_9BACI|nr:hypothetical protein [Bacillus horti]MDQ0166770.1 hypothetical protein [Bacillus horti]